MYDAGLDGSSRRFAGLRAGWSRDERAKRLREHAYSFGGTLVPILDDYIRTQLGGEEDRTRRDKIIYLLSLVDWLLIDFAKGGHPPMKAKDLDQAYNTLVDECVAANLPLSRGSRGSHLLNELYGEVAAISEFLVAAEKRPYDARQAEIEPMLQQIPLPPPPVLMEDHEGGIANPKSSSMLQHIG